MLKIYASRADEISEGFVWLENPDLPNRCVVRITNPKTKQTVFCEVLQIESNFLRQYNQSPRVSIVDPQSAIVMGAWYRKRLGNLETQHEYPLEVVRADPWLGSIRACIEHPQIVVRMATRLGLLSVGLGILGAAPYIVTMWPTNMTRQHFGLIATIAGTILLAFSVRPRRQYQGRLARFVDEEKRNNPGLIELTETRIISWLFWSGLALVALGSGLQW